MRRANARVGTLEFNATPDTLLLAVSLKIASIANARTRARYRDKFVGARIDTARVFIRNRDIIIGHIIITACNHLKGENI